LDDKPSAEPQIVPPNRATQEAAGDHPRVWISFTTSNGRQKTSVRSTGAFAILLALLVLATLCIVVLFILASAILIWIPLAIAFLVVLFALDFMRKRLQ
jgi:cobalamin biosynthesis protein CobD/CbiB